MATQKKKFVDADSLSKYDEKIKEYIRGYAEVDYDADTHGTASVTADIPTNAFYARVTISIEQATVGSSTLTVRTGAGSVLCSQSLSGAVSGAISIDAFRDGNSVSFALQGMLRVGGDAVLLTGSASNLYSSDATLSISCQGVHANVNCVKFMKGE